MPVKSAPAEDIRTTIRTLDSKINLVVERLKTLESNQEIAGRTLLALKDQVRRPAPVAERSSAPVAAVPAVDLGPLQTDFKKLKSDVKELTNTVEELKYVLDQINPLNYATVDQVKDLLDEKLKKK
ncbi:hypothetical protein HYV43_05490 [Candidatus Micrarchaeota archaeon]|nr:hypothetical protein [Candidatus Micrarchaeota archaeon]